MHFLIHMMNFSGWFIAERTESRKGHYTESKAFEISILTAHRAETVSL